MFKLILSKNTRIWKLEETGFNDVVKWNRLNLKVLIWFHKYETFTKMYHHGIRTSENPHYHPLHWFVSCNFSPKLEPLTIQKPRSSDDGPYVLSWSVNRGGTVWTILNTFFHRILEQISIFLKLGWRGMKQHCAGIHTCIYQIGPFKFSLLVRKQLVSYICWMII